MVYFGRVLRNNDFGRTGRIDVLLGQRNFFGMKAKENDMKELKENVDSIPLILGKRKSGADSRAVRCLILGGIANSPNAGMLQLPQVGSTGLVLEVVNEYDVWPNEVEYFWLGGLWGLTQFPGYIEKDCKISLPHDDTESEEISSSDVDNDKKLYSDKREDSNNIKDSPYIEKGQFIIKTKTCDVKDPKSASKTDYDYDKIPGENTLILNRDKYVVRHNIYEGEVGSKKQVGIEQLTFEEEKSKLFRRIKNDSIDLEQHVRMDNDGLEIFNDNKKEGKTVKMRLTSKGDFILTATDNMKIIIDKNAHINIKGDAEIKVDGNAKVASEKSAHVISKDKMTVSGAGQNMADIIHDFAEKIKNLKTLDDQSKVPEPVYGGTIADMCAIQARCSGGYYLSDGTANGFKVEVKDT